ncbi:MAG: RnfABCDGE type electron transport complex subunit G [Clostridia bacterium]|nr:RnfABCDGE type electron transport complex subunit G [Clostridia bacterium]
MSKTIFRETLHLVIIVLTAVLCLSLVYELTKDRIASAEENDRIKSYKTVFAEAEVFEDAGIAPVTVSDGISVDAVLLAKNQAGRTAGYVLSLTTSLGYGGNIVASVGVDLQGKITGMTVTSMSETPALGAKCTESDWQAQFAGIGEFPIVYVKGGRASGNEIDAISGATTTTKAIVGLVNAAHEYVASNLLNGGAET